MNWTIAFGLALALAFVGYRLTARRDLTEAKRLVAEGGALLVDVRTATEFASGHLDGARNIPVQELGARLDELGDRSRPVVVYCRSGARSARAKRMLEQEGFPAVLDAGPMSAW